MGSKFPTPNPNPGTKPPPPPCPPKRNEKGQNDAAKKELADYDATVADLRAEVARLRAALDAANKMRRYISHNIVDDDAGSDAMLAFDKLAAALAGKGRE